jgi:hypothetical protein
MICSLKAVRDGVLQRDELRDMVNRRNIQSVFLSNESVDEQSHCSNRFFAANWSILKSLCRRFLTQTGQTKKIGRNVNAS